MFTYSILLLIFVFIVQKSESSNRITLNDLNDLMVMPIRDVLQLELHLRNSSDATNIYVQWFLNHSQLPIVVQMKQQQDSEFTALDENQEQDPDDADNRLNLAIVTSLSEFNNHPLMSLRGGIYFNILEETETDLSTAEHLELEQLCRLQWTQHKIYNRYILTTYGIWIYDPFGRIGNGFGRLIRYTGDEILPTLLFHDMRGYPLRVQMFRSVYAKPEFDEKTGLLVRVTGLDWLVAQMLQEKLNFTMVLQQPDRNYFGERSANGSYNGAIGSIIRDGLDICLTGFFVKDYLVPQYMDFTVAVYDDELCIYVPKASRIPQSILPIFAVGYDIWMGFILSAFVCATVWLILRMINLHLHIVRVHGKRLYEQALAIMVDTWVVWVRVNLSHLPESYAERMFIGSLCLVSVIFGAIFESSLATVYIHPLYYRDIITLQDLDDSGLNVVYKYTSMADDLFFSETSPLFASLNKKLVWNSDLNMDVIDDVARHGGKAGVTRYLSLMLESSQFILTQRVWVVPECPKYYTISYVMPRNAPWGEAINALLLRLLNAGIIAKWAKDQKSQVDIRMRSEMLEADANGNVVRVLTINDLQLAFYVVMCGNIFALVGFLIEHGWQRMIMQHQAQGKTRKNMSGSTLTYPVTRGNAS